MLTLLQRWYQRHFSQPGTIEFALVLIVAFITVYYFMWLVGPIIVALCFAFCLDWPVVAMQRRFALSRKIGSIIVMVIFSSVMIFTTILIVPSVIKQGAEFYNSIVAFSTDNAAHKQKAGEGDKEHGDQKTGATLHSQNNGITAPTTNKEMVFDHALKIASNMVHASGSLTNSTIAKGSKDAMQDMLATPQTKDKEKNQCLSQEDSKDKASDNKTTIVYIANGNDDSEPGISSSERMAKAVANAALVAAELNNKEQQHKDKAELADKVEKSEANNPNGYHITLIDSTGDHLNLSSGDGQFTLTAKDFDMRLAEEIHDVVQSTPDPLPSMLTLRLIEDSVRSARIAATNKMADVMRTQLMPSVVNAFTWLVYAIIVPIFTFLMLYNKEQLKTRAKIFILPNNQQLIRQFWPSMHSQIAGYIRGKLLHIIIISIANTLAFMLLGMNYALLLGVGVGLSVVIPYVGAVIIAVPVVMIAIFQFGFSGTLVWVLAVYTLIQLLDSNVLTPMLFSKAMNLDAFSILAAILIFGNLWGFWGVFFAIPLATFVKTLIVGWPNAEPHDPNDIRI